MATTTRVLVLVPLMVLAVACGSDGDASDDASNDSGVVDDESTDPTAPQATASEDTASENTSSEDTATAPAPESSGGGATLTLANGETFEFPTVLCSLESQMSAGSEILFSATSYDDPGLDITQFGDEGTVTGVASISVYDGDFETLWDANTMFGSSVELTLEGTTIRGTGSFLPGPDLIGDAVEGEVVANC